MTALLELEDVEARYGPVHVLHGSRSRSRRARSSPCSARTAPARRRRSGRSRARCAARAEHPVRRPLARPDRPRRRRPARHRPRAGGSRHVLGAHRLGEPPPRRVHPPRLDQARRRARPHVLPLALRAAPPAGRDAERRRAADARARARVRAAAEAPAPRRAVARSRARARARRSSGSSASSTRRRASPSSSSSRTRTSRSRPPQSGYVLEAGRSRALGHERRASAPTTSVRRELPRVLTWRQTSARRAARPRHVDPVAPSCSARRRRDLPRSSAASQHRLREAHRRRGSRSARSTAASRSRSSSSTARPHVINFAQGELAMLTTYIAYQLIQSGSLLLGGVLRHARHRLRARNRAAVTVIRPVQHRSVIATVIVTVGLFILIDGIVNWNWGGALQVHAARRSATASYHVGGVPIPAAVRRDGRRRPRSAVLRSGRCSASRSSVSRMRAAALAARGGMPRRRSRRHDARDRLGPRRRPGRGRRADGRAVSVLPRADADAADPGLRVRRGRRSAASRARAAPSSAGSRSASSSTSWSATCTQISIGACQLEIRSRSQ